MPPPAPIMPSAILEGKKPGARPLTKMCRGPSSTARLRARCRTAALEAEYEGAALAVRTGPRPMPATEPVTRTREGSSAVARACKRGANLLFQMMHVSHVSVHIDTEISKRVEGAHTSESYKTHS
jgi:hypothetical protein